MATLLDDSRPNITVTNTATETAVYTVEIPGGTLGTTKMVFARLVGAKLKNGGGVDSHAMRVYYGSTLLVTLNVPQVTADSADLMNLTLEVTLSADGATGAQVAHCHLVTEVNNSLDAIVAEYGTATEDSTGNLDLEVTWQQPATNLHAYTSQHGTVLTV